MLSTRANSLQVSLHVNVLSLDVEQPTWRVLAGHIRIWLQLIYSWHELGAVMH